MTMFFCRKCDRPLDRRYNKKYDGIISMFCNKKCEKAFAERKTTPRNRKKYGLTGYVYDGYHKNDILKKREAK